MVYQWSDKVNTGKKTVEFDRSLVNFARAISVESYKQLLNCSYSQAVNEMCKNKNNIVYFPRLIREREKGTETNLVIACH